MGRSHRLFSRMIAQTITSTQVDQWRQQGYAFCRKIRRKPPTILYFHQADDPYSQLAASMLQPLQERYHIKIRPYLVHCENGVVDHSRFAQWACRDAERLCHRFGLNPVTNQFEWPNGNELLKMLGHYSSAMFYFEGTWYWGIDRLHYLEYRLMQSGLASEAYIPLVSPPELRLQPLKTNHDKHLIHFFCSLRSPYTWLAVHRMRKLTEFYSCDLEIKFVLPMVMRGMPVPLAKRLYILRDAKRESQRLDLPFGRVVDPLGVAVERGLALLQYAIQLGIGLDFLESFLKGVFAEGVDAESNKGLSFLAHRSGLTQSDIADALADSSWRQVAESNRQELLALGLWGVPSFYCDAKPALWGQDRLWMLEEDLLNMS
ncbi:MAG: hypothetical protein HKM02_11425 [Pseudomonadales bacterium]|nr:hypothetical protein [Pseudomonadales bacterium]